MARREIDEAAIFNVARRIADEEARRHYLQEVCGDGPARARLDELLRIYQEEQDFLAMPLPTVCGHAVETLGERPGCVVGSYQLIEQIGEGGFGIVFAAEQLRPLRRRVALKILKPGMDTRQVIARFEAERQVLALMDHDNIAHIFDGGATSSGRPYFVMELVRGLPITDYCDQHRLSVPARLALFLSVCSAVQHAHQKGIIHRDLKPSNILVSEQEDRAVVKVIDFGIAKVICARLTDRTRITRHPQLIGTPTYMSPEQARLGERHLDTRSDVYSLGVLLYELLTGSTPFDKERLRAAPLDELQRILCEEEPPRPSLRLAQLRSRELDWIVLKALDKEPKRRYDSASSLAADLQRYLHDEPVQACPPSLGYRLRKLARRNKGPVLASVLVLLALVGGMIGTMWGLVRATRAWARAEQEAQLKEAARAAAQHSESEAREQLFQALLHQARAQRYGRQMGQRWHSLEALAAAARLRRDDRLRDEVIAALALPDVRRVPGWRAAPPGTAALAYNSNYTCYARADSPGVISVRRIPDDQELRRIASGPIPGTYLYFSPDGRFLVALGEASTLRVWRVADGTAVLDRELPHCHAHAFRPGGRELLVGQGGVVLCFDLESGRLTRSWPLSAEAWMLAFHPDGRQLAVSYLNAEVVSVVEPEHGAVRAQLPVGPVGHATIAWHPDGERLALSGTDPRIQIWNVTARRQVATLEGHSLRVTDLTFHPDGELLASYGWDGRLLLWHPASGLQLMRLTSVRPPRFSADGRRLAVLWERDRADFLEVTPNPEYRTLVSSAGTGRGHYCFGDISPDGRLLVVGLDAGARLWDLRQRREVAALPAGTSYAFFDTRRRTSPNATPTLRGLLTGGTSGLKRWPMARPERAGLCLQLGPPQTLSPLPRAMFRRSPAGQTLAVATAEGGPNQILDLETDQVRCALPAHADGEVRALSGDGRWAASCGWHSDRVRLWNLDTRTMVHEWMTGKHVKDVFFTPDSRQLIVAREQEFTFWDVSTLQRIRQISRAVAEWPGWVAFSGDGKLMAIEMAPGIMHLMEVSTARTLARLGDPNGDRASWQGFTPDGARLVIVSALGSAVHIWDLRALRAKLKEFGLDWDWPAFSTSDAEEPTTQHQHRPSR